MKRLFRGLTLTAATAMSLLATSVPANAAESMTWSRTWYDAIQLQWQPLTEGEIQVVGIENWKPEYTYPLNHSNAFFDGDNLYAGYNPFCRYDLDGNFKEEFSIDGLNDVWKATTDGTYCYMIEWEKMGIFVVDMAKRELVRVISTPGPGFIYYLQYVPSLDEGRGGFVVGNYRSVYFLDMDGTRIGGTLDLSPELGDSSVGQDLAVVGNHLYVLGNDNTHARKVFEYDLQSLTFTGNTFDLHDFVGVAGVEEEYYPRTLAAYSKAGGREYLMFVDYSGRYFNATSVLAESLPISESIIGYNIYRDGVKLNDEPLSPVSSNYDDTALEQGKVYSYELCPTTDGGELDAVATASVELDDTRTLPMTEDFFYLFPETVKPTRLSKSYTEFTSPTETPAWSIYGNAYNNVYCAQYYHGNDIPFEQTLLSRPLYAPECDSVKVSISYSGNTYTQGLDKEMMNVEVCAEGSDEWITIGSVAYKAQFAVYTDAVFDATEAVRGKTFRLRLRASGAEGAPENYNWQIENMKVWCYNNADVNGVVTFGGEQLSAAVNISATLKEVGTTYTATTDDAGNFSINGMQSGDYTVTVSRGDFRSTIDATIDASASAVELKVPGGRFAADTKSVNTTMGSASKRHFEIPFSNIGDAAASQNVIFEITGSATEPDYGSIIANEQWKVAKVFAGDPDNIYNALLYYNGKFYQKSANYSPIQINEVDASGNVAEAITLTYETEGVNYNITGYFSTGDKLFAYTQGSSWSNPPVPTYIVPVDLGNGKLLDSQKLAVDTNVKSVTGMTQNKQDGCFYVLSTGNLYRLNEDGTIGDTYPVPDMNYRSLAFDNYSVGGPYVWMVKSNYSPVGYILGKYSLSECSFVETYDANKLPKNIFGGSDAMLYSPASGCLQPSLDIVSGYYSLVFMQAYSSRSGARGSQVYVLKVYPTETWIALDDTTAEVEADGNGTIGFTLSTEGLADGEHKSCNLILSSLNFADDVVVAVDLNMDKNAESDYPGAKNIVATLTDNQSVKLDWNTPSSNQNFSHYAVLRNGKIYDECYESTYTDFAPLFGNQEYEVTTVYADGTEVASDAVSIDVQSEQWAATVEGLEAAVDNSNVTLSWEASRTYRYGIYNDFQSETAFSIEAPEGWTFVDGDNAYTFSSNAFDYEHEGERMAAMIYAPSLTSPADTDLASEGDNRMLMFTSTNIKQIGNDDWVISPLLDMNGPIEVSFRLRTRNAGYGTEQLAVAYSMTGDNTSDFLTAGDVIKTSSAEWQRHTVEIPAGARYVALHYVSNYTYQLFVDDLFVGEAGQYSALLGYNIYRDGVKLNEQLQSASTVTDENLADGSYIYTVEAVYANGATGKASTEVTVNTTGVESGSVARPVVSVTSDALSVKGGFDRLTICNATGVVVAQHGATAGDFTMPRTDLATGVYVITIETNGVARAFKVLL